MILYYIILYHIIILYYMILYVYIYIYIYMYTADADRGVKLAGHAPAGLQYLRARTQVLRHSATPIASRVMFTAAKAFFRLRSWLPWDIPSNAPLRISHRRANSNSDLAK